MLLRTIHALCISMTGLAMPAYKTWYLHPSREKKTDKQAQVKSMSCEALRTH
jgi:hypothetical protein